MISTLSESTSINQQQDWLKTNLAAFTRMLQGERDLATVASGVAVAGGLWILAAVVFSRLDEPADESAGAAFSSLSDFVAPIKEDDEFRTYLVVRGLMIATALAFYSYWVNRKMPSEPFSPSEFTNALRAGGWSMALPLILLGGIYSGFFAVSCQRHRPFRRAKKPYSPADFSAAAEIS